MPLLRSLTLALIACCFAINAQAQSPDRIVAVFITADTGNERAARFEAAMQGLNAETLLVEAPNDAQLRALLQRFTAVAVDTDVAIVYIDAPILMLGDRPFVGTQGLVLPRASSLLTRAVPLSAFARATSLAGSGGVVIIGSQAFGGTLPAGATEASRAPAPRNGLAPIVFMSDSEADRAIDVAIQAFERSTVELGAVMQAMRDSGNVTLSETPVREIILRAPAPVVRNTNPAPATTTAPQATETATTTTDADAPVSAAQAEVAETVDTASAASNTAGLPQVSAEETEAQRNPPPDAAPRTLSLEELQALENNLSRTAKRNIQRGLRERGFYRGLIDGLFGRQTKIAIEAFQESLGEEPTGVLTVEQLTMFE